MGERGRQVCRLYGIRASAPTRLDCALRRAQNALLEQSRSDGRNLPNADGWGVGFYEEGRPRVEKQAAPAFSDERFRSVAGAICSPTVVAHVRRATVGEATRANAHPFTAGTWLFAHNGTVAGFRRLAPALERETTPDLLSLRRGTTDSELAFAWILSRLVRVGLSLDAKCVDGERLSRALGEAIGELASRAAAVGRGEDSTLNVILTDGLTLAAVRWGGSLFRLTREAARSCGICGETHARVPEDSPYRAAAVASEPITGEGWEEVPERSLLLIDRRARLTTRPIG